MEVSSDDEALLLLCLVLQRLQEAVQEGNLEPREQMVALEAQVCIAAPLHFPLLDSTLAVFTSALPPHRGRTSPAGSQSVVLTP